MKNVIKYYYGIDMKEIHQINKIYKMKSYNKNYIFQLYERKINELEDIYNLHVYINLIGIKCHRIVLRNDKQIITYVNKKPYILLEIELKNRRITMEDIIKISNIQIDEKRFNKLKRKQWDILWSKKIDYIEYQINQFAKKYKLIRESSDYYIGIVENCISLAQSQKEKYTVLCIAHDRINKETTLEEYYNPLNFILDNRVRDISELIKSYMVSETNIISYIKKYISISKLTLPELNLMFARILYPSIYLDKVEKILSNNTTEKILFNIEEETEKYEKKIKKFYNFFRTIVEMPEIEWLIEKPLL